MHKSRLAASFPDEPEPLVGLTEGQQSRVNRELAWHRRQNERRAEEVQDLRSDVW